MQTPLLLIHGAVDGLPIEQAEEFFSALYRQGKRAQFVRYWGESHNIQNSAANVRDLWSRIFAWFDEFADIARDPQGNIIFEDGQVRSRRGAPAWTPADFLQLDEH